MPNAQRRATIQDVARVAAVSPTTVSHFISGRRNVSARSRAKITAAIEELEYSPSETARALRTQRTRTVALIIRSIVHDWAAHLASGAGRILRAQGYSLAIYETEDSADVLRTIARSLRERRVDGAIVGYHRTLRDDFTDLSESIPLVFIGSSENLDRGDTVSVDEAAGIEAATRHVSASTSRRIAFISGPESDPGSANRTRAFVREIERLRPHDQAPVHSSDYSTEGGATAMRAILRDHARELGGVVCANDLIAIGAMAEARAWGMTPPADFVITGYDNIEAAAMVTPSLTTVETFEEETGARSAECLLARLDGSTTGPYVHLALPTKLIIRGSAPAN